LTQASSPPDEVSQQSELEAAEPISASLFPSHEALIIQEGGRSELDDVDGESQERLDAVREADLDATDDDIATEDDTSVFATEPSFAMSGLLTDADAPHESVEESDPEHEKEQLAGLTESTMGVDVAERGTLEVQEEEIVEDFTQEETVDVPSEHLATMEDEASLSEEEVAGGDLADEEEAGIYEDEQSLDDMRVEAAESAREEGVEQMEVAEEERVSSIQQQAEEAMAIDEQPAVDVTTEESEDSESEVGEVVEIIESGSEGSNLAPVVTGERASSFLCL